MFNKIKSCRGTTLIEVLIASFLTALISAAAFNFYTRMDSQTETQFQFSDALNNCRISLDEVKKNIRRAGFKLPAAHTAFDMTNDSMVVYFQESNIVDTIHFYLEEFSTSEYETMSNLPSGLHVYKLIKQVNSDAPQVYSDYLTFLEFELIDTSSVIIKLEVITGKKDLSRNDIDISDDNGDDDDDEYEDEDEDEDLPEGMYYYNGYLFYQLEERVQIRNLS